MVYETVFVYCYIPRELNKLTYNVVIRVLLVLF